MKVMNSVFEIDNLTISYEIDGVFYDAIKNVSFSIPEGKITGIIGESGCGKSTLGLALIGLLKKGAKLRGGKILFEGRDIFSLSERERIFFRKNKTGYIHQNPFESLNPIVKIKKQLEERCSGDCNFRERVNELFEIVNLKEVDLILEKYPFELSGGQNQRVSIVSALLPSPEVVIADEPTTALDVTVQSMILSHLLKVKEKYGLTLILISHDVSMVSFFTDYVIVLYGGRVVEMGGTDSVMKKPIHPYTVALLNSVIKSGKRPSPIEGEVPSITDGINGCPFHPRCKYAFKRCSEAFPSVGYGEGGDHIFFCHLEKDVLLRPKKSHV